MIGLCVGALGVIPTETTAHVRYVTEEEGEEIPLVEFLLEVLTVPTNLGILSVAGLCSVVAVWAYLRFRPGALEIAVIRATLREYTDLVPWLLRLAIGLPLVGAGFAGYFFTPEVPVAFRLFKVTIGFMLLFGLATRIAAGIGLLSYLVGFIITSELALASEYLGGFLAIIVLGSGRPSADQVLGQLAEVQQSQFRRFSDFPRPMQWIEAKTSRYGFYAPVFVRFGLGINFIFLGLHEKILNAGRAKMVVDQYDLTEVVPVDAGMWVLGAGLTEIVLGVALLVGFFVRASACVAFSMFTLTLFALPDDPVLAHISLFGMVSVLLITGSGPLAIDQRIASRYPEIETSVSGD